MKCLRSTLLILFTGLVCVGCATHANHNAHQVVAGGVNGDEVQQTTQDLLETAKTSEGEAQQEALLLASKRQLQEGLPQASLRTLSKINPTALTPLQEVEYRLMHARLDLFHNKLHSALSHLKHIRSLDGLSESEEADYFRLAAAIYKRANNPLSSMKASISLGHITTDPKAKLANDKSIWTTLQTIDENTLQDLALRPDSTEFSGWIQLAFITREYANNPTRLTNGIVAWKRTFPYHPAQRLIPTDPSDINKMTTSEYPEKIALLLPLSGKLAKAGEAIRDGFMQSYYNDGDHAKQLQITLYDTNKSTDMKALYEEASKKGATLVVGPLNKANVQTLAEKAKITVPVLALNDLPNNVSAPNNLLEFGLSPQDEAHQAANKAWQDGHTRALLIYPQGEWGDNIASAFTAQFQNLGGAVVDNLAFPANEDLSKSIGNILGVGDSIQHAQNIERIIGEHVNFTPKRRNDIDMIFLLATPHKAQSIRPLLRFYYAGNLPVYATSTVYDGYTEIRRNRDLDGIVFCDMPWLLDPNAKDRHTQRRLAKLWPQQFDQHIRLYALGMDAYNLTHHMGQMDQIAELGVKGKTGLLYLANDHQIFRRLPWAKFVNGKASTVS